jgi:hypothetical protein
MQMTMCPHGDLTPSVMAILLQVPKKTGVRSLLFPFSTSLLHMHDASSADLRGTKISWSNKKNHSGLVHLSGMGASTILLQGCFLIVFGSDKKNFFAHPWESPKFIFSMGKT